MAAKYSGAKPMGLNFRIIYYHCKEYFLIKLLILIPLLFMSCGTQKSNPYILNYQKVDQVSVIGARNNKKQKYRPEIKAFKNGSLCINEYQNLKTKGYKLLGYSLFQDSRKQSFGMAVQMGKVNGAELILLSREKNNASSNDRLFPALDKLIEDGPIIKAIFEDETPGNQSQLNLYSHLALFLIKM
jgi:hypothetical protein